MLPLRPDPACRLTASQEEERCVCVFYLCLNRFLLFPSSPHLYALAAAPIQHVSRLCYLKCLFSLGLAKEKRRRGRDGNLSPLRVSVRRARHSPRSAPRVSARVCSRPSVRTLDCVKTPACARALVSVRLCSCTECVYVHADLFSSLSV